MNDEVTFDKVVAVCNRTLKVGKPYVKDAFVKGTVLKNGKGKKVTVFTYKPKKSVRAKWVTDSPILRYRSARSVNYDQGKIFC